LTDLGLVLRTADPQDGRRVYIELAPETADRVGACLKAAQRISPLMI
jgi:DNA-binding MarR family transcriptional regulator